MIFLFYFFEYSLTLHSTPLPHPPLDHLELKYLCFAYIIVLSILHWEFAVLLSVWAFIGHIDCSNIRCIHVS